MEKNLKVNILSKYEEGTIKFLCEKVRQIVPNQKLTDSIIKEEMKNGNIRFYEYEESSDMMKIAEDIMEVGEIPANDLLAELIKLSAAYSNPLERFLDYMVYELYKKNKLFKIVSVVSTEEFMEGYLIIFNGDKLVSYEPEKTKEEMIDEELTKILGTDYKQRIRFMTKFDRKFNPVDKDEFKNMIERYSLKDVSIRDLLKYLSEEELANIINIPESFIYTNYVLNKYNTFNLIEVRYEKQEKYYILIDIDK